MSILKKVRKKIFGKGYKVKRKKRGQGPKMEASGSTQKRTHEMPSYRKQGGGKGKKHKDFSFKAALKAFLWRATVYAGIVLVILVAWVSYDLPDINDLNKFTKAPSILIKSEDGQIIGSFGDIYGDYIPFNAMPMSLVDAVVATEDRNFYHHFGVDPFGLIRAMAANVRAHHVVQGGSTITQQVAKNVFLTPERSLIRKIKEMLLAIKLERRFSKQDIMSIYLNRVYLGAGNYGVDAASRRYFDKSARELTLSESAIMAGLLKAPSRFAPTSNPALSTKRAEQVLVNMADAGYLTEAQATHAREELTKSMGGRKRNSQSAMYFADWIMDQLPEFVANVQEDMIVTSTLRPDWQLLAEKSINDIMDKDGAPHNASQAALVSMTPDGAIRAMIGGRSYAESQFNRAAQSLRQPGSSFKLFVYLAGLESGFTPETMVDDHPISIKIVGGYWQPHNYTNKYLGEITLKEAVTQSVNTVAVQVAEQAGLDHVISVARRLGITSDLQEVPSIALGSTEVSLLELTNAYAHLATGGGIVYPYGIIKIETARGEPLYERSVPSTGAVLQPSVVGAMNEMLESVVTNGTGKAAQIGRPIAGKTGTTSDYRDAWFMGFTPDLVTGVWVGNDNNTPMKKVTGGMLPAQIWHGYMANALKDTPPHDIPRGGGFFSSILPWQGNIQERPLQPGQPEPEPAAEPATTDQPTVPVTEKDLAPPSQKEDKAHLGPQFWNTLLR